MMRLGKLGRPLRSGGLSLWLAAAVALGVTPAPALAGGGGQGWSQAQQVLTLSATPGTLSPLVSSGGLDYLVATINGAPELLTNAGGAWQAYSTGITDYNAGQGEGHYALAVSGAIAYIAYVNTGNDLKLAFAPAGPAGAWSTATIVAATPGQTCGPGVDPTAPSAAVIGGTLAVAFEAAPACNANGSTHGQDVYVATVPMTALSAGATPQWQVGVVTAGYTHGGYYPALAGDGSFADLAYQDSPGDILFVRGEAGTDGFTWPTQPQVVTSLGTNDRMDEAKLTLAAQGGVDVLALYTSGTANVVAATNLGGTWSTQQLFSQDIVEHLRPTAALGPCGPAVAFEENTTTSTGDQVAVATFASGAWNSQNVSPVENPDNPMWPGLAATSNGLDLTYLNDNSGSSDLFATSLTCSGGPVVTSISPTSGPAAGGTQITVNGSGFTGATAVVFAGSTALGNSGSGGPAASFQVVSDTQIIAVSPPGSATVDVRVLTPGGESAAVAVDQFTYQTTGGTGTPGFTDLGGYAWAQNAIDTLAKEGIIHGVGNGQYDPAGNVTRAQFASLMMHAFALPQPASPIAFADVSRGSWEYQPVEAASPYYDYYQLPGGGFAFHPDQGFDRQDVATVIVRILVKSGKLQLASSAQTQAILAKFTDASDIAPSLQPYVATAVQAGIMAGFPDGSFQPQTVLNRAQVAAVLLKLQNYFVVTGS